MGTQACVSAIFTKGNNFHDFQGGLLEGETLLKWSLLLKERICSKGANSSLLELIPIEMGGKNEICRVIVPGRVPLHLKPFLNGVYS